MYEQFYGLTESPFQDDAQPKYFYIGRENSKTYKALLDSFREATGPIFLKAARGMGKTILLRTLSAAADQNALFNFLTVAQQPEEKVLPRIFREFQIEFDTANKETSLLKLHKEFRSRQMAGKETAIILDDADFLPDDELQDIQLLAEFTAERGKLVSLVLATEGDAYQRYQDSVQAYEGAPSHLVELPALTSEDIPRYLRHRLHVVGRNVEGLFTNDAVSVLFEKSMGTPAIINEVCEKALVLGLSERQNKSIGI